MVTTTIQEQVLREAPEIEAIKLGLLQDAKGLASTPLTLPLQQIAGLSGLQQKAFTGAQQAGGIGGYQPFLSQGQAALGTGLDTVGTAFAPVAQAQTAAQGMQNLFQPSDLSAYTNPFQQAVIDETMAEINRQGAIQQNSLAANAVNAGAFGGSRFGVQEAEFGRNQQDVRARALAQLNQQNYAQAIQSAQQAFEAQQGRQGQASQLLSGIGQLTGQLGAQQAGIGGQQLASAELAQQTALKDLEMQQKLGAQQQGQQQSILNAQQINAQKQQLEPYSRVAFLSDIYKGAPSTQTSLGSQVTPSPQQPSTFQQVAGLGTGLLGTAAATRQLGGLF
jgi:hypothetical protein|tara:strand:- start:1042 stop:2046 length:1005 start_codon:yes stop_codon:yes gene_type:complete